MILGPSQGHVISQWFLGLDEYRTQQGHFINCTVLSVFFDMHIHCPTKGKRRRRRKGEKRGDEERRGEERRGARPSSFVISWNSHAGLFLGWRGMVAEAKRSEERGAV